ncbi:DsrE family protein [Gluconobacter kanchanaburiensis]|uniref:Uncharacterized protein n=1 Tax=Gluconobacter kanchanaburiensis NBRC 103587 TaxID=1307948 RepID=A0A511B8G6_9PROT|nr:DsrE family protein [Gluconobacter kanchanaburiensis]MBF0862513.1 hypothetical protein [Gluconobacter kanchanaburiensis]GBR71760.1 hypothetical protein AA103587_2543 [Gluconobacter kanchanaburiensis NBRC 103587]GEK96634.1 hypothetical protein GKA01_18310 [Gluconobacter kanchanaburiensis NBRC 103587]
MKIPLFLTLADDSWQRAHYALVLAAGALSLGRSVTVFAGGRSVLAFTKDWSRLAGSLTDSDLASRGIAGFEELRDAVMDLGATIMVCETGLKLALVSPGDLLEGVSIKGIVSFLELAGDNPVIAL